MKDAADKALIDELIQRWAYARDQCRWDRLADTFVDGGRIAVSWFNGTHGDFIAASRARAGKSFSKHMMSGTVVSVHGDRAFAETNVFLVGRSTLHGVAVVSSSYFRFLDTAQRTADGWRLDRRSAIYESDSIAPEIPGASIDFDRAALEAIPRPFRFLGYRLVAMGLTVPLDLPVAGSADEERIRAEYEAWSRAKA